MSTQTPVLKSLLLGPQDGTLFGNGCSRCRWGSAAADRGSPNPKTGILVQKVSLETRHTGDEGKMERRLYKPRATDKC